MTLLRKSNRSGGITLIETIVYIACLGIILTLAGDSFFRVLTQTRRLTKSIDRLEKLLSLGERWRSEIRSATIPVDLKQANQNQSLHIVSGATEIIYTLDGGNLFRLEKGKMATPSLLFSNFHSASFSSQQISNVTAWSWRVEIDEESSKLQKPAVLTFLAVPTPAQK